MIDKNEALFVVRLPVGTKTVDFDDAIRWIAQARYPPLESLDEHGLDLFGADWARDEAELKASIERGDVEVLDSSYHAFRPPFTLRRLEKAVLTVKAFRQYVQSINGAVEVADTQTAPVVTDKAAPVDEKPWLRVDPRDPNPEQHWYTPARYFARQLVIADTTLLTKKLILADKVSSSLAGVGIFKRGGKKPHAPDTVLKAFANVPWG